MQCSAPGGYAAPQRRWPAGAPCQGILSGALHRPRRRRSSIRGLRSVCLRGTDGCLRQHETTHGGDADGSHRTAARPLLGSQRMNL